MKGFDVLHVKSAVKQRNKFDLSRTHLTTMDFGQIVPLFAEETVPGDDFTVRSNFFSRLAPLVKPTYGKFSFKTVSVFVPYHQVAEDADAWLAGKTTWEGITTKFRHITLLGLVDFYIGNDVSTATNATADNCDISYKNASGTVVYKVFTPFGRFCNKVLNSLGYVFPTGVNLQTNSVWMNNESSYKLSAYPLLAFFKAYNDYMSQSQRFNISPLTSLLKGIKHNTASSTYYDTASGKVKGTGVLLMFQNLLLNYENGYFTSAWQNPNFPLSQVDAQQFNSAVVPGTLGSEVVQSNDRINVLTTYNSDGSQTTISQRALDFLRSFDNWVRRNSYSGSRAVQQLYSRFGIKTDDYRSNYAHVIDTDVMPISVGDVTATAEGSNVPLGDYAGKGILSGDGSLNFKADDYGLLMILGYYTVVPMMSYGFNRMVLRNSPFDFYNPEFDGIGADPISMGEVFADSINASVDVSDSSVFGFTERYNSYRYGRDVITGDFRNLHPSADMNTWHTGRLLNSLRDNGTLVAQSSAVNTLAQTGSEYNRIFSITDDSVDHFYMTAQFFVDAVRPMLNLNQVVNLGEGDTAVPRNGNVIS